MLITIPDVLTPAEVDTLRGALLTSNDWIDGNATSGSVAAKAKRNRQLPSDGPLAGKLGTVISSALGNNGVFLSAAMPKQVFPPLFSRYGVDDRFDTHVDNAIRVEPMSGIRIRTDLSATLFLTPLEDYDGGELIIDGSFGAMSYRLPPGHMVLYPSTSLHRVAPITRGERLVSFFWMQSVVRDHEARSMLFDLDQSIQALSASLGGTDQEVLRLTALYHNLVRRWSEL